MMIMYYTREKLVEVIKFAYKEKYEKYTKFFIDMSFRECDKAFSKYDFAKKRIVVNTLSRSSGGIFISYLVELGKHIDIIERKETHNDSVYLGILRKLLDAALKQHILTLEDLQKFHDDKMKQKLQESFGTFSKWANNSSFDSSNLYIRVYDAIMIRNILKHNGYFFDYDQNCWQKKSTINNAEDDLFIFEYKDQADFLIMSDNRFLITPVYKLCIYTFAKDYNEFLKALNYQYDSKKNLWWKVFFAKDYRQELTNLKDVPKQKIFISRNIK